MSLARGKRSERERNCLRVNIRLELRKFIPI